MPLALVLPVRFHLILRHPCTLLPVARLPVVVVVVVVAAAARVVRVHLHLDQVLFILSPAPHGRRLYLQVLVDRAHAPRVPSVLRSALLSRWHPDGAFWPKNMEISKGAACPALFFWRRGEKPRSEEGESKEYETKGARSDGTVFLSEGSSRDPSVYEADLIPSRPTDARSRLARSRLARGPAGEHTSTVVHLVHL